MQRLARHLKLGRTSKIHGNSWQETFSFHLGTSARVSAEDALDLGFVDRIETWNKATKIWTLILSVAYRKAISCSFLMPIVSTKHSRDEKPSLQRQERVIYVVK